MTVFRNVFVGISNGVMNELVQLTLVNFSKNCVFRKLFFEYYTAWKVSYSEFFWSLFSRIKTECGKTRSRKTPHTDTFHEVLRTIIFMKDASGYLDEARDCSSSFVKIWQFFVSYKVLYVRSKCKYRQKSNTYYTWHLQRINFYSNLKFDKFILVFNKFGKLWRDNRVINMIIPVCHSFVFSMFQNTYFPEVIQN